jgi:hypothetical protein
LSVHYFSDSTYNDLHFQPRNLVNLWQVKRTPTSGLDERVGIPKLFPASSVIHDLDDDFGMPWTFGYNTGRELAEST